MAKQLVLSGNRIIAHGEDCFLSMGGTVICPDTEKVYQNATLAVCEGGIPADIDEVGYEYHAGEFVPCAPFGKETEGTVPVLCNECKTIRDSGISVKHFGRDWVTLADVTYAETTRVETVTLPLSDSLRNYSQFAILAFYGSDYGGSASSLGLKSLTVNGNICVNGVEIDDTAPGLKWLREYRADAFPEHFSNQFFPVIFSLDEHTYIGKSTCFESSEVSASRDMSDVGALADSITLEYTLALTLSEGAHFIVIAR